MYRQFTDSQLLTPNQSGFRPDDSTINQLLHITQKIYTSFEDFPSRETHAVFLDISKAFDKVWHEGLVFKLKTYGIFGLLLALIYRISRTDNNDLVDDISSDAKLFDDDTSLFTAVMMKSHQRIN